ncbi:hypothetical protein PIB30_112218, partial [Stylosanthes scabra]|nr:hypothetical protein [Stylosanthes scabra]
MPEVLEISSDEEQGPEEGLRSVDIDWIKEFLGMSDSDSDDDDGKSDDSDDVIIISENKPHQPKSKSSTVAVKNLVDDDDDGDCVVLDGDPENGVTCVDDEPTGSDEVLVVGEKGQARLEEEESAEKYINTSRFVTV